MKEEEFRKCQATRMTNALWLIQNEMDKRHDGGEEFETLKDIYSFLEELTQLRARLAELNKGFLDPETGKLIQDCTPYAIERLKHRLRYLEGGDKSYRDKMEATVLELRKQISELTGEPLPKNENYS